MKIAVYGSAVEGNEEVSKKAFELGKAIAEQGCIVVTGGCKGLPYDAVKGAYSVGGKAVAYSPAKNMDEHTSERFCYPAEGFNEFIFVKDGFEFAEHKMICMKFRNILSVANCDAGIIVGGRIGTLNEFTILYDTGKVIGILKGTDGISNLIPQIVETANKKGGTIIYEEDPVELVKKVIEEVNKNGVN